MQTVKHISSSLCFNHRATVATIVNMVRAITLFVLLTITLNISVHSFILSNSHSHKRALILPLALSHHNASRNSDHSRRNLLLHRDRLATARMRLYDDLLSNGYYTTRIGIGTPPQEFSLIVDTGSTVTYVPCSGCIHCGKHQDPRFRPELSSTYKPVKCNRNCVCDDNGKQCTYHRSYAEMSSSSGLLGEDVISFGKESELLPQHAVFGCENVETGEIYSQRADGIMGLGRSELSVVDQLLRKGVISDSFSLCYGGMGVGGGAMILGGISPPPGMVFSRSDPSRSAYYNIELKEIHVDGEPLRLSSTVFDGKHGTVLDSGTTYAYLPEEAYVAFKNAVIKKTRSVKQIPGPDPRYNDICFSGAERDIAQLSKAFPEVDMVFGKVEKLSLSPENYLFRHTKVSGAYCLGIFQNRNDATTLLGGIVVRNTLVTYDRGHNRIGFWKTNCSELSKRLQSPGSPALPPSASNEHNSSSPVVPNTGIYQIGQITFNMSFSTGKPNFTELTFLIAHGLEIDNSRVHLLDYYTKGNKSIMMWSIFPADPGNYISSSKAMKIITRLRDHQVQLPERFGSYQLVEWEFEPQSKLTRRQDHYLFAIVGLAVSLVLSLSGIAVWLVWRHRRQTLGSYEPVVDTVTEQELQPI